MTPKEYIPLQKSSQKLDVATNTLMYLSHEFPGTVNPAPNEKCFRSLMPQLTASFQDQQETDCKGMYILLQTQKGFRTRRFSFRCP